MQAVILAAGEGRRMRPLTLERPKPLIAVAGRPILGHIIDALPKEIDEVIFVVGYKAEMIKEHFGKTYNGRSITHVHQRTVTGTAGALRLAKPFLKNGRFMLMCGDDIHGGDAIKEALSYPLALLVAEHSNPSKFGVIELATDGSLAHIVEKPDVPPSNLVSTGAMVLDDRIFEYEAKRHGNGEYYVPDALNLLAKDHRVAVVRQNIWIPIGYPEDIPIAEKRLRKKS